MINRSNLSDLLEGVYSHLKMLVQPYRYVDELSCNLKLEIILLCIDLGFINLIYSHGKPSSKHDFCSGVKIQLFNSFHVDSYTVPSKPGKLCT